MTQHTEKETPAGYWKRHDGHLTPEELVKPIDKARDHLVRDLITRARSQAKALTAFKSLAFGEISAFLDLSAEQYGVSLGGEKGNLTLTSYDGRYQVRRQVQDTITFDERLQIAKKLIDECIVRWGKTSAPEIRVLVDDAFQVNKQGRIDTNRVLRLKHLAIDDEQWQLAMQAISDSITTSGSSTYLRFYERVGESDQYEPISLDVARA